MSYIQKILDKTQERYSEVQRCWFDPELSRWFRLSLHWFVQEPWFSSEEPDNMAYMAQQEHCQSVYECEGAEPELFRTLIKKSLEASQ